MVEGMLMNAVLVGIEVMKYRDQRFQYEWDADGIDAVSVRRQTAGKQYCRKRLIRATHRSTRKSAANKPGCGIGARHRKRWNW